MGVLPRSSRNANHATIMYFAKLIFTDSILHLSTSDANIQSLISNQSNTSFLSQTYFTTKNHSNHCGLLNNFY